MKRLLHCGFCGEEEDLVVTELLRTPTINRIAVTCGTCYSAGPHGESFNFDTARDVAISQWNERLPHEQDLALRTAFRLGG